MRTCEWCRINLAFDGELCNNCTNALAPKNQALEAHAKVDEHIEGCSQCRIGTHGEGLLCETGSALWAHARAIDGRIDAEYAAVFGVVDPERWMKDRGKQVQAD